MNSCFRNGGNNKLESRKFAFPTGYYYNESPFPDKYFPLFEIVKDYTENKFRKTRISKCNDQIIQERKIFAKDLQDTIYLRTYHKRPDLFQAAIVGLPNTPFEDGIYVFDLKVPTNYPKSPPSVIYHSHGHKLRPSMVDSDGHFLNKQLFNNLDSNKSILLEVLLYIQHIVLNGEPYSKVLPISDETHRISKCRLPPYLYAYQSMVDILDDKPSLFKRLICRHFLLRGDVICKAFDDNVKHHVLYGHIRGVNDFCRCELFLGNCYSLPKEFPRNRVIKLRVNMARVFAENQAYGMIPFIGWVDDARGFIRKYKWLLKAVYLFGGGSAR